MKPIADVRTLLSAALQLGATRVFGWSNVELQLICDVPEYPVNIAELGERINAGEIRLGMRSVRFAARRRGVHWARPIRRP